MSGPRSIPSAALAVYLCLLGASALLAQAPAGQPAESGETFFESIDVEVINVEVYVTDRRGRPVLGLGRDDFQLFEDGKPVAITNFYAEAGAPATPADAAPADASAAPAAPATPPPAASAVPDTQRLHIAVFLDNRTLAPAGRNRVIKQIEGFLAGRPKGHDRLFLVTYNGALAIEQAPTDDPAALSEALRQASRKAPRGVHALSQTRRFLDDINQLEEDDIEAARQLRWRIESYSQERQAEIHASVVAAGELVDWLAGLPGRKALLYVSGGLSLEPGEALIRAWEAKFGAFAEDGPSSPLRDVNMTTGRLLDRLAERANANRVTFYSLGAVEVVGGVGADHAGNPQWQEGGLEFVETSNKADSLLTLAAGTGGLAALDAAQAGTVLARMRNDLDSYYSLGFASSHPRDGKVHRLEVKVRERGLVVRHREAYRANSVAESMSARSLAALALGEVDNPLGVALDFGEVKATSKRGAKNEVTVPVLVRFGLSDLVLVPRDTVYEGRVRLYVAARDERGRTSPVVEILIPIKVPQEQLQEALGQQAGYVAQVRLRPGPNRVVVTLLDDIGKVTSTVAASYPPGEGQAAAEGRR